jgi:hypothetical protein
MLATATVLVRRWRASTGPARRVLAPVYVGGLISVLVVGLGLALDPITRFSSVVGSVGIVSFISVPYLFLAGLLRTRLARAGAAQLLQETPETPSLEEAQAALRRALNDPTLRLLVRDDESGGYLDAEGRTVEVPDESPAEAVSRLVADGRPIAAVVHDPALRAEPELLDDVARGGASRAREGSKRPGASVRASGATARCSTGSRTTCSGSSATAPSSTSTRIAPARCRCRPTRSSARTSATTCRPGSCSAARGRFDASSRQVSARRRDAAPGPNGRLSDREIRMVKSG